MRGFINATDGLLEFKASKVPKGSSFKGIESRDGSVVLLGGYDGYHKKSDKGEGIDRLPAGRFVKHFRESMEKTSASLVVADGISKSLFCEAYVREMGDEYSFQVHILDLGTDPSIAAQRQRDRDDEADKSKFLKYYEEMKTKLQTHPRFQTLSAEQLLSQLQEWSNEAQVSFYDRPLVLCIAPVMTAVRRE